MHSINVPGRQERARQMNRSTKSPVDSNHTLAGKHAEDTNEAPASDTNHRETASDAEPPNVPENVRQVEGKSITLQRQITECAVFDLIKRLLPVLDSLEAAMHAPASDGAAFLKGVELIRKQLLDVLFASGLRPIPAKGHPFNPEIHQSAGTIQTNLVPDQHVFEELRPGYKYKERLLRPSLVTVARNTLLLTDSSSSHLQNGIRPAL